MVHADYADNMMMMYDDGGDDENGDDLDEDADG